MPLLNGVTSFLSQPVINSTILANTDNSSSIPTTSWSNAYWAYVKTNSNTWTAPQTFTTGIIMDNMSGSSATSAMKIGSNLTTGSITLGTATSTTTLSGTTYINKIDTITPSVGVNIYTNSTSNLVMGNTLTSNTYIKGANVGLGDDGGNVYIGTSAPISGASSTVNIRVPITPGYSYPVSLSALNQIGGRYENGGFGGAGLTVYGDGQWRNYLYVNSVPQGMYLVQYWVNLGGMTYTSVQQRFHLSATAFTGVSNVISTPGLISQSYINPVPNILVPSLQQISMPTPVYVDSSTPNLCFAMACITNTNAFTYHGLVVTRIA